MVVNGIDVGNLFIDELKHHGVLGMKWGIRRYQPYSVRGRKSGKKGRELAEAKRTKKQNRKAYNKSVNKKNSKIIDYRNDVYKNRRIKSDAEIDRLIKRLEKEKRLKDLMRDENIKRIGEDRTQKVLLAVGTGLATATLMSLGKQGIKKATKDKIKVN